MNLTEEPEIVDFAPMHYVFVEKTGPFMKVAPEAWQTVHSLSPLLREHNQIKGGVSLYRMDPNTYRAGFSLEAEPVHLPQGLTYEKFAGGRYSKFVLTGPYSDLPAASGRAWEIVGKSGTMVRSDSAFRTTSTIPSTHPPNMRDKDLIPTE